MSSIIKGTSITLTRGDTLRTRVVIILDGQEYTPVAGDSVRFALKHTTMTPKKTAYKDTQPLLIKPIPIDTMILQLEPQDTKPFDFDTYVYDIQITFADGTVCTFITQAVFKLTPEVH